jgi:hypothetical protein
LVSEAVIAPEISFAGTPAPAEEAEIAPETSILVGKLPIEDVMAPETWAAVVKEEDTPDKDA